MEDFLYENAPLVEVIAEVRWELKALQSHPEARIDPYFELFREQFVDHFGSTGFNHVEQLIPKEIPVELLPYKPHFRLRTGQNEWPLFQIGPGLFTANIVPPYLGWNEFSGHLSAGLQALAATYPLADKTMKVVGTELRYIDAFTQKFGMENYAKFLEDHLAIPKLLPQALLDQFVPADGYPEARIENRFPLLTPESSVGFVKVSPGTAGEQSAVVVELICRKTTQGENVQSDKLEKWFGSAHMAVRTWFDTIAGEKLKERMGPKTPIGEKE